ncbi:MAG: hypothetical protein WAM94_16835 [Chromatiaceae bacterium]
MSATRILVIAGVIAPELARLERDLAHGLPERCHDQLRWPTQPSTPA